MGPFGQIARQRALHALHVILVLEQYAEGIIDRRLVQVGAVHRQQCVGPVERLRDARRLEQIVLPSACATRVIWYANCAEMPGAFSITIWYSVSKLG